MRVWISVFTLLAVLALGSWELPAADDPSGDPAGGYELAIFKPQYLPPSEILLIIGALHDNNIWLIGWELAGVPHEVEIRLHDGANMLFVSGPPDDVDAVLGLIQSTDVPPRQVEIEAKIVEVNRTRIQNIGLDWDAILVQSMLSYRLTHDDRDADTFTRSDYRSDDEPERFHENEYTTEADQDTRHLSIQTSSNLQRLIRFLDESGAGTVRNAPRILTINNRAATILDGERVTYVTHLSSYSNIFETDTMDAGLTLSVLPSIGESGYLTLDIHAELSALVGGSISGSPVKRGQIVDNTVIVKDGEPILLGGFQRTVDVKGKKRFPILGHLLPFLFSRETSMEELHESYIILQARVLDQPEPIGDDIREMIQ